MDDDRPAKKPIQYASVTGGCGVSRRGFRVLLFLTFINTILLGTTVAGPQLHQFVSTQWSQFQERRAARAAGAALAAQRARLAPVIESCMTYQVPANTLVYAEDPDGIRAMNAVTSQPATDVVTVTPASAAPPACFSSLPKTLPGFGLLVDPRDVVCFLHARKPAPDADPFLLVVQYEAYNQSTDNRFLVLALAPPTDASSDLVYRAYTAFSLNGKDSKQKLQLFAGHEHPTDASAFIIPYALDGKRGEFIGQVDRSGYAHFTSTGPVQLKLASNGMALP
jgi:hypothetical protein